MWPSSRSLEDLHLGPSSCKKSSSRGELCTSSQDPETCPAFWWRRLSSGQRQMWPMWSEHVAALVGIQFFLQETPQVLLVGLEVLWSSKLIRCKTSWHLWHLGKDGLSVELVGVILSWVWCYFLPLMFRKTISLSETNEISGGFYSQPSDYTVRL